ncbi:MAG TPA: hypothetical protein PLS88_01075 [Rectinema sp.]|jgi:hypothetical protein|nr:hypothetical protein [Spirochaetia bacterium]HAL94278.1 hypothetical protein [Spirochaetaceae bacterium]HNV18040.1 hypothetical protein [Rectinema sp.]HNY98437.1 hypothetical protein [Rectinema sp.]HOD57768.1 hypothetical protein [Rectinema sp.]
MLVLVLIEEKSIANVVLRQLNHKDIASIAYRDPLRVLDHLTELNPEAVIIRGKDFPLHQQLLAALVRFYAPLKGCKMIVLGRGIPDFPPCICIAEEQFLREPSIITNEILKTHHIDSKTGSRLVAKAQRTMKL